jgi:HemY protein
VKGLFWVLALFALAVAISLGMQTEPGYVILVYPPYRIEMSLALLLAWCAMLFFLGYGVVRLATHTLQLPAYVRDFRARRRHEKGHEAFIDALMAFFEGRYNKAERLAVTALEMEESPVLSATLAARAAHELKAFERRDGYLARAESMAPEQPVARLMTQAELLLDQRRNQHALAVLKQLQELEPRHVAAQKLELKAQQATRNWGQVLALITQLEKKNAIEPVQADQLRINAHLENLKRKTPDAEELKRYWQKIPSAHRLNGKIALAAAESFLEAGANQMAAEIVEACLEKEWNAELVSLYGNCPGKELVKQIERAEKWLASHPHDAALLMALGRLCARQELWGKAQSYLEASLSVEPSSAAHLALAQLLERMNRVDEACKQYRQSLDLTLRL